MEVKLAPSYNFREQLGESNKLASGSITPFSGPSPFNQLPPLKLRSKGCSNSSEHHSEIEVVLIF